jgi:SAM-dependent methyltransferase
VSGLCPLCGSPAAGPGWIGATSFEGRIYRYVECSGCRSLFCDPMPDAAALSAMYGSSYRRDDDSEEGPRDLSALRRWLSALPPGVILDFGCGHGAVLELARAQGWTAMGVEWDPAVCAEVERRTGCRVLPRSGMQALGRGGVDAVHLGDVIEHLTDPAAELAEVLPLVKAGGTLLAQGPLEGNANLFTLVLRAARRLGVGRPVADMPPYHVVLATSAGQQRFFARLGLTALRYDVTEVAWPAPARLRLALLRQPRAGALFALRRVSQLVSAVVPGWGTRYFFAGEWTIPRTPRS